MTRKRVTQIFPFLLPLRRWQRKKFFYLKRKLDGNRYAEKIAETVFSCSVFEAVSPMINENSGFDRQYQINKIHNLKLAAQVMDGLIILPGETFSFWQLVRFADKKVPYRDGLAFVNGQIKGTYGGGLCALSDMLFWMFLHTPMTVIERHGHAVEAFPKAEADLPCGTDAAVSEGWLDLRVRNETENIFQIKVTFDEQYMYGHIFAREPLKKEYAVFNSSISYEKAGEKLFRIAVVNRLEKDTETGRETERKLYVNQCEVTWESGLQEKGEKKRNAENVK